MFLSEFIANNDFTDAEAFLARYPHPFLLEEGVLFAGGKSQGNRLLFYLQPQEGQLIVGRKAPADLLIRNDPTISGRHLQFLPPQHPGKPWQLIDLKSTNGTFLNGSSATPLEPCAVEDRTVVGIGPSRSFVFLHAATFRAVYTEGAGVTPDTGSRRPTEPIDVSRARVETRAPSAAPASAEADERSDLYLYCASRPPLPIQPGQPVIIGRSSSEADLVLPHAAVSRRHAEVLYLEDGVYVRDLGSANGVLLDDREIGREPVVLPVGGELRISDFRIKLCAQPGAADATVPMDRAAMKKLVEMDISELPLGALLETIERKHKSGAIKVLGAYTEGEIVFQAGKPHAAKTRGGLRGVEAIRSLLEVTEGTVIIDPNPREAVERAIDLGFTDIIKG